MTICETSTKMTRASLRAYEFGGTLDDCHHHSSWFEGEISGLEVALNEVNTRLL